MDVRMKASLFLKNVPTEREEAETKPVYLEDSCKRYLKFEPNSNSLGQEENRISFALVSRIFSFI